MWIAGAASILVAIVFPMDQYENFLLFIGAMFIPLFGVVLTDYFILRRGKLEVRDIYEEGGLYWYRNGYNLAAIAAWVVGFVVYETIALLKVPVGGSIPSMLVAGTIYWAVSWLRKR
jgi:cytosine/uracil/thiamine/allantoin permease